MRKRNADMDADQLRSTQLAELRPWFEKDRNLAKVHKAFFGNLGSLDLGDDLGIWGQVNTPEKLVALTKAAEEEAARFKESGDLGKLYAILRNPMSGGDPGHDRGHAGRDILRAVILSQDQFIQGASLAEQLAFLLGAFFHDNGTGVVHRYVDARAAGHSEVGGYNAYLALTSLGYPNLAVLVAYAIGAHTHVLAPVWYVSTEMGGREFQRLPYPFWLFSREGVNYGIATVCTRLVDRLEILGMINVIRHIAATIASVGIEAAYGLAGGTAKVEPIDEKTAAAVMQPLMVSTIPDRKTAFQHTAGMQSTRHKNMGGNPNNLLGLNYNSNDPRFETARHMMEQNSAEWEEVVAALEAADFKIAYDREDVWQDLASLLALVNPSPAIGEGLRLIKPFFDRLPQEHVNIWGQIVPLMMEIYQDHLEELIEAGEEICQARDMGGKMDEEILKILEDLKPHLEYDAKRIQAEVQYSLGA